MFHFRVILNASVSFSARRGIPSTCFYISLHWNWFVQYVATVNQTGSSCPYALKMIACQLLLEITSFLRETHQHLPRQKARPSGCSIEPTPWSMGGVQWTSGHSSGGGVELSSHGHSGSNRRWSSVFGSPGNSERSNSRSSQGDCHTQGKTAKTVRIYAVFLALPDMCTCT